MAAVQRWGNSLAVRIPARLAESLAMREGTRVELECKAGAIVMRPQSRPRHRLSQLLRACATRQGKGYPFEVTVHAADGSASVILADYGRFGRRRPPPRGAGPARDGRAETPAEHHAPRRQQPTSRCRIAFRECGPGVSPASWQSRRARARSCVPTFRPLCFVWTPSQASTATRLKPCCRRRGSSAESR